MAAWMVVTTVEALDVAKVAWMAAVMGRMMVDGLAGK